MGKFTFEATDANFQSDVLGSEQPVLVDFWAEWCGPCRQIAPAVEAIAEKYQGRLRVAKMDVDSNPNTPGYFGIMGIPTLILFKGGKPVSQIVGLRTQAYLENEINKHVEPVKG